MTTAADGDPGWPRARPLYDFEVVALFADDDARADRVARQRFREEARREGLSSNGSAAVVARRA